MATQTRVPHGAEPRGMGRFSLETFSREMAVPEGRFGHMFEFNPFAPADKLLIELAATMVDRDNRADDNPEIPSGFTVLGQFIDHDLTFDATPLEAQRADPHALTNFRSPRFDLDSLYGWSPTRAERPPRDPRDPDKMLIANLDGPVKRDDLPRRGDETAIIGDPRNDENLLICQLHLAFLKFHNKLVDQVREGGTPVERVFEEARRLTCWHYQWIVVHDFLYHVVGQDVVDQILQVSLGQPPRVNLTFYKPANPINPMMPLEFAVAAYRFGHSMVRPVYVVGERGHEAAILGAPPSDLNLTGGRRIPPMLVVAWRHFFRIPGEKEAPKNAARKIDARLAGPLFDLPSGTLPPNDPAPPVVSLAARNLLRGKRRGLPSGQRVAEAMARKLGDVEVLSNRQLGLEGAGWCDQAPLWFYILAESKHRRDGRRLGPVGGRIVAEVLLGLLAFDRCSYLNRQPAFRPTHPIAPAPGQFSMGDLLRFAEVA